MKNPVEFAKTLPIQFKVIVIRGYSCQYPPHACSNGRNWDSTKSRDLGFRIVRSR
jgi:hypothetical protein